MKPRRISNVSDTGKTSFPRSSKVRRKKTAVLIIASLVVLLILFVLADLLLPPSSAKRYQHDKTGRLISQTTPRGRAIKYGYNKAGLLTELSYHRMGSITEWAYPSWNSVKFEYDLAGNHVGMKDKTGRTRYRYDDYNRPIEVLTAEGKKISYEFDPWGNTRQISLSDGYQVKYKYDLFGNIIAADDGNGAIRYEYLGEANQIVRRLPNGITTTFEFSPGGRLNSIRHSMAGNTLICSYRYEYDPENRVNLMEETTPQGQSITRYEHDLLGRLIKAQLPDNSTITYEYDVMGNRKAQTDARGATQYEYDPEGRLVRAGQATFAYDKSGNLISKKDGSQRATYKYDEENRLIEVQTGGAAIRYGYDGEGNRVWRKVNGKTTRYLNHVVTGMSEVVAEYDDAGKASHYLLGQSRVAQRKANGEVIYFLEDHLGSTRCAVDAQGKVLARYTYSPFGVPTLAEGTPQTEFLYTGEQWDAEAQLVYLRARYYDPQLGRFLSTDPLPGELADPQSFNQYAYVSNDPLNRVDPLGTQWWPPPYYNPSYDPFKLPLPSPHVGLPQPRQSPQVPHTWLWYYPGVVAQAAIHGELFQAHSDRDRVLRAILQFTPGSLVLLANDVLNDVHNNKKGAALLNLSQEGLNQRLDYLVEHSGNKVNSHLKVIGKATGRLASVVAAFDELSQTKLFKQSLEALSRGRQQPDNKLTEIPSRLAPHSVFISDQTKRGFFPPPGGGGSGGVPSVGGVYLDQTAKIIGDLGAITGAMYDAESGQIILVGDKNTALPPMKPEYLAAAIRAVYSESPHEPGMTIDPHPQNPRGPVMVVIFFGNTENTRLGWVMFESDRVMKGYSVGLDNVSKQPVQLSVPGYRSVTAMGMADSRFDPELWSRFWLVPEPVTAQVTDEGRSIIFDPIRMCIKTETMRWAGGKLVPAVDKESHEENENRPCWENGKVVFVGDTLDPHAEAFARHFTENYEKFAQENPIYAELKQVAQAVALAKWMKQQDVPVDWNFVRVFAGQPHVTPKTTPSVSAELTQSLGTSIRKVMSFGGVKMTIQLEPQKRAEAAQFQDNLIKAWATARKQEKSLFRVKFNNKEYEAVALPSSNQRELAAHNAVESDLAGRGISAEMAGLPGLTRHYNSTHNEPTEFGFSWSLLLPRLEFEAAKEEGQSPRGKKQLRYLSVEGDSSTQVLVQRFALTSQFGLGQERFDEHFVDQNLKRIGFKPAQSPSNFLGLYPEGDGSYRLIFTGGDQAIFDSQGKFRALLTPNSRAIYDYDDYNRLMTIRLSRAGQDEEVRFDYDAQGHLAANSFGAIRATYGYDETGNLRSVKSGNRTISYRYDSKRLLAETSINNQTVEQNKYDEMGRLVRQRDTRGNQLEQSVETTAQGKVITTKDGAYFSKRHYDAQLRLTKVDDSIGSVYQYSYDGSGYLSGINATLPTGGRAKLELSPDGKQVMAQDPRGVRTEYRLNPSGQLAELLVNGRRAAAYRYGASGQLAEVAYEGEGAEQYVYDAEGRVSQYRRITTGGEAESAQVLDFSYDQQGNLTGVSNPALGQINLSRQPSLASVVRGTAALTYRYGSDGQLSGVDEPDGSSVSYIYKSDGQLRAIEVANGNLIGKVEFINDDTILVRNLAGGQTKYVYTSTGLLASVQDASGARTSYNYDGQNRLREARFPDGSRIEYKYESARSQVQTVTLVTQAASKRSEKRPLEPEIPKARIENIPEIRLEDIPKIYLEPMKKV